MAVSATPVFPQTPKHGLVQCVNADGTNKKTVITAGSNGSKVLSLLGASDDTSDRTFLVYVTRSGTSYLIGSCLIPDLSGTDGGTDPTVNLLNSTNIPGLPVDNDGQRYLLLQSGDTLDVALTTGAVTAGKTVHFSSNYADF